MKHLISLQDFDSETLARWVERGLEIAKNQWSVGSPLDGKIIGIYFRGPSTRTRTSFSVGALKLGAQIVNYGPQDLQISTGETYADTSAVLAGYLDGLVIRSNGPEQEMRELAGQSNMAIINAMSEGEHPTQVIGDLITLKEHFGSLTGLHVPYVGEGNNTAAALGLAMAMTPNTRLTLATPKGYGLKQPTLDLIDEIAAKNQSVIHHFHDLDQLPSQVDAVYATRWETMGVQHQEDNWRDIFRPYCVDSKLMKRLGKSDGSTIFLHDLPAIRGSDVTDEVLDSPASLAFRQAKHKLTSAMAILEWAIT